MPASLLKGLEDEPLLLRGDADASVVDGQRHNPGCTAQHWMIRAPAGGGEFNLYVDLAVLGELERVGEQVLQNLLQPLRVGCHCLR